MGEYVWVSGATLTTVCAWSSRPRPSIRTRQGPGD